MLESIDLLIKSYWSKVEESWKTLDLLMYDRWRLYLYTFGGLYLVTSGYTYSGEEGVVSFVSL